MSVFDPLAPFHGGVLHRLDIRLAEAFTGVPRRSISRHLAAPLERRGYRAADAVAIVHWLLLGLTAAVVGVGVYLWVRRPTRSARFG